MAHKRNTAVTFTEDGIAVLRMCNGENRINDDFLADFNAALDEVEKNSKCIGLMTTGEGKFFSNGLDLRWLSEQPSTKGKDLLDNFGLLLARLLTFPVPTVAAINGHAIAGGCLIALAHDLRVMNSDRGWISMNEVFNSLRIPVAYLDLIRMKLESKAYHRLTVFGKMFPASEAAAAGIVDKAVSSPLVENESLRQLNAWIGKKYFPREGLGNMKKDVYADVFKNLHSAADSAQQSKL